MPIQHFFFFVSFKKAQAESRDDEKPPTVTEKLSDEEKDEDEQLLQEFEDEMSDLSVPSDKIEEIKEEMQKEFDNIINEVSDFRQYVIITQKLIPIKMLLDTIKQTKRFLWGDWLLPVL